MPPDAMRSRISYWPNRSGLDEGGGSGARGSGLGAAGALGAGGADAGGGVAPGLGGGGVRVAAGEGGAGGRAAGGSGVLPDGDFFGGIERPESVSESIRSMSASVENFFPAAAAFSAGTGPLGPVRTVSRDPSISESVSRSLRSISASTLEAAAGFAGAGGGAAGAAGGRGGTAAGLAGAAGSPVTSFRTSAKMSDAVSSAVGGAAATIGIRTVRDPMSVDSSAERTELRRSSSEKGLTSRSKAPTRWAAGFGLLPL